MCLFKIQKSPADEPIAVPARPISTLPTPTSQRASRTIIPIAPPTHTSTRAHSLRPISSNRGSSREIRRLNSSGRLVVVETITPRGSEGEMVVVVRRGREGSLQRSPRHSGNVVTPRQSQSRAVVTISPRQSGAVVVAARPGQQQPESVVTTPRQSGTVIVGGANARPGFRSRRESTVSVVGGPRASQKSLRSRSYASTREKMVEFDEGGGERREWVRRDDARRV